MVTNEVFFFKNIQQPEWKRATNIATILEFSLTFPQSEFKGRTNYDKRQSTKFRI